MARRIPEMEPYAERIKRIKRVQDMAHAEMAAKLEDATGERWDNDRVGHLINARMVITIDLLGYVAEVQQMPLGYYVNGELAAGKARELLAGAAENVEYANLTLELAA